MGDHDPAGPFRTLFTTPPLSFTSAWELGPYLLLALWVALLSMIYVRSFYGVTHLFHRLRMPRIFKPAVGAFLTGAVGLLLYYAAGAATKADGSNPVLSVLSASNLDHALEIANSVPYALTGGLYSRSPAHIARVRREFRVGNLYINRKITGALVDRQPFGGFKMSGIGSKAGGPDYLLQFVLPRTITENTLRRGFAPSSEG